MNKPEKTYNVVNGTSYDSQTPEAVINALENARRTGERIVLTYGDTTGKSWGDTYDVTGTIGRSTGNIKIPLLIKTNRSIGGGSILDSRIIRIRTAAGKRIIWKAKNFQTPTVEVTPSDMEEYSFNIVFNGQIHSRHRNQTSVNRTLSIIA